MTFITRLLFIASVLLLMPAFQPVSAQGADEAFAPITPENAHSLRVVEQLGYGWLHAAVWTPDSQHVLAASSGALVVYQADDFTSPQAVIPAAHPPVVMVVAAPDGTQIAFAEQGYVRVMDGTTFTIEYEAEASTFRRSPSESHIQFTDSYLLALLLDDINDYALRVWDRHSGALIATIPSDQTYATPIRQPDWFVQDADIDQMISAERHALTPAQYVRETITLDGAGRVPAERVRSENGSHVMFRLCPNDQPEPWNCQTSTILLRDETSGEIVSTFALDTQLVGFLGDRRDLLAAIQCSQATTVPFPDCQRWQLSLVDALTGDVRQAPDGYFINPPDTIRTSPDQQFVLAADSAQMQIFDTQTFSLVASASGFHGPPIDVEFSADGQWLAASASSIDGGRAVNLWQHRDGAWTPADGIPCGGSVALHPTDDMLLCGGASDAIRGRQAPTELWRLSGAFSPEEDYPEDIVLDVAYSPDGEWVIVSLYSTIEIRSAATGLTHLTIESAVPYSSAGFSDDMEYLFLVVNGRVPFRYRWQDVGAQDVLIPDHSSPPFWEEVTERSWAAAAFSHDGRWMALGRQNEVALYDAETGERVSSTPLGAAVVRVLFSPDNRLLGALACQASDYTGLVDCSLIMIDVSSSEMVFESFPFTERILSLAFDPTGRLIATTHGFISADVHDGLSSENGIRLWAVPNG